MRLPCCSERVETAELEFQNLNLGLDLLNQRSLHVPEEDNIFDLSFNGIELFR